MSEIEFVLLEDEEVPNYEKYKDMFENSKIIEETTESKENNKKSNYYYSISIKDFDILLYEYLAKYSNNKIKVPKEKYSIAIYKNSNVETKENTIIFKNHIDVKDILDQLKIIINMHTNNSIKVMKSINMIIKLNSILYNVIEYSKFIVKYPIIITKLTTPMVIAITPNNNKIIGYISYKNIVEDKSIFIEYMEVIPDSYNVPKCACAYDALLYEYTHDILCKQMISYLISKKPDIIKYKLTNVHGVAGYCCYTNAFDANNFISSY